MLIETVKPTDIDSWLELVKEVEPLFGPMIGTPGFCEALTEVIQEQRAYCIKANDGILYGAIVINHKNNEIEWFAVSKKKRRMGYGTALLRFAINKLDNKRPITVQTFDNTVIEGSSARKLYVAMGFQELEEAGFNPAGLPTVILKRVISCSD